MLIHQGKCDFRCSYNSCGNAFRTKDSLDRHLQIHYKLNQKYSCSQCPSLKFENLHDLRDHKLSTHEESEFRCTFGTFCEKTLQFID